MNEAVIIDDRNVYDSNYVREEEGFAYVGIGTV